MLKHRAYLLLPSMVIRICFVSNNRATAARRDENSFRAMASWKCQSNSRMNPASSILQKECPASQTTALTQTLCPLAARSSYRADEREDRELCLQKMVPTFVILF